MHSLQSRRASFGINFRNLFVIAAGSLAFALALPAQADDQPAAATASGPAATPGTSPTAKPGDFYQFVNATKKFKDEEISWKIGAKDTWHTFAEAGSAPAKLTGGGRIQFQIKDSSPGGKTYEDFIEFTHNNVWNGNTTQVDAFVIPLTITLYDKNGGSQTMGITKSRSAMFAQFKKEAPPEFQSCIVGDDLRIASPHQVDMGRGKPYADYFQKEIDRVWTKYATEQKTPDGWTGKVDAATGALTFTPPDGGKAFTCKAKPNTEQALLGTGPLGSSPSFCSAINRGVLETPGSWSDPSKFYQTLPYNYYAKFMHEQTLDGKDYGFCYDDYAGQAAYMSKPASKLVVTIYWDTPPDASADKK